MDGKKQILRVAQDDILREQNEDDNLGSTDKRKLNG
jgi:hypothetical protein